MRRRAGLIKITGRSIKTRNIVASAQRNIMLGHRAGFKIGILPIRVALPKRLCSTRIYRVINIRGRKPGYLASPVSQRVLLKLCRVQQAESLGGLLYPIITIVADMQFSLSPALFGGDDDYTISSPRTVNGCSRCILQYIHGFYVPGIKRG